MCGAQQGPGETQRHSATGSPCSGQWAGERAAGRTRLAERGGLHCTSPPRVSLHQLALKACNPNSVSQALQEWGNAVSAPPDEAAFEARVEAGGR